MDLHCSAKIEAAPAQTRKEYAKQSFGAES
jgi:hypothetical protein